MNAPTASLVHPTALVDAGARLAGDVKIGAYTVIGPHVEIGPGTTVGLHWLFSQCRRTIDRARNPVDSLFTYFEDLLLTSSTYRAYGASQRKANDARSIGTCFR